ncbi:MAG: tRNA adenosine(34) deaminase TadA [Halioglobus sp.]
MSVIPSDEQWMRHALELARRAGDLGEVPVGAVVVKNGELLGEGWNTVITRSDPSAHAEMVALRDAARKAQNYRLPGVTLYVTLEPCTMCAGALVHSRVQRLVFGAYEPKAGTIASNATLLEQDWFNHKVEWTGGVLEAQSADLLQGFFRARR